MSESLIEIQDLLLGSPAATATTAVAVTAGCLAVAYSWTQSDAAKEARRARALAAQIPMVPMGFMEAARHFFGSRAPQFALAQARQLGKVYRMPLVPPNIPAFCVVCDHVLARAILEDSKNTKWDKAYEPFDKVAGGVNFFSAEGFRWKHVRKRITPFFGKTESFYAAIVQSVDVWIDTRLQPAVQANQPVDVSEEMQQITIDVMARAAFDYDWQGDEAQTMLKGLQTTYLEFFRHAAPTNLVRFMVGPLHPDRFKANRASRDMRLVIRQMLETHRQRKTLGTAQANSLIALMDENENYACDEERIRDMVLLFAGGYDTSSFSLSWILLELARHGHVQDTLRQALTSCQTDEEAYTHPYLKCVIRESMRLHATAALGSLRLATRDIAVSGGMVIPKGAICGMPIYALHRDADVFDKPDTFDPERWANPTPAMMAAYQPYSVGRRNCVGQALAQAELQVVTATLVHRFAWTVVDEGVTDYYVTLKNTGCRLRAVPVEK